MRLVRLPLAALSVAGFVIACSSSDTPAPASTNPDGGSSPDGAASPQDGAALPEGGGDTSTANPDASLDADAAAFTLTSAAYAAGASIPAIYTCNGTNVSPPLAWTAGPAGTMGYAVVFTDLTNGLIHSVIYDIPSNAVALPDAVPNAYAPPTPAGSHQTIPGFGGGFGYRGPCPPKNAPPMPDEHIYEFELHAVDVAVLPGAGMTTTTQAGQTLIKAHSLGATKLTAKYKQP